MQILDELEHSKRGPYGGGFGHVSFTGGMDMALALRTMVIPTKESCLYKYDDQSMSARREWTIHLQAGAGVVADSIPENEFEETVNKAAALGRAIDLAESSFIHLSREDKGTLSGKTGFRVFPEDSAQQSGERHARSVFCPLSDYRVLRDQCTVEIYYCTI
eukprot:jgi/Picre1/31876/NNA_007224.t1